MHLFKTQEEAFEAFEVFDRDGNGDVSKDEFEMACIEVHRERLALSASMRDISMAVQRLDGILMSVYLVVAVSFFLSPFDHCLRS